MAVYRVERTRDYTVMSNHHLKDPGLSLKAKGLLAIMLSLPDDWNYSTRGLAAICKEGVEAIGNTLKELERAGYVVRRQLRDGNGRVGNVEYTIYEKPQIPPPAPSEPDTPPRTRVYRVRLHRVRVSRIRLRRIRLRRIRKTRRN